MKSYKQKRILVACNHLQSVGGSELYSYYLIKSLLACGHEVDYFTFHKGLVSAKVERELHVHFKTKNNYDIIFASHQSTVNYLFGQGPILQICHGPIPELEQPSPLADYHISVSEEISNHLQSKGFLSSVILNGVDLEVFRPVKALNRKPKKILSLCQSKEANAVISAICDGEELEFKSINKHTNPTFEISDEINEADLVIGIGRSAYDAMACGRPCILFDKRSYNGSLGDGYLYPSQFGKFAAFNCSGRYTKRSFTRRDLANEINKYNPAHGKELRAIARKELNVTEVCKELLEIGTQLSGWKHLMHESVIMLNYHKYQSIFTDIKRAFRAKMKAEFTAGTSTEAIKASIAREKFTLPVRLSLYLYWFHLRKQKR